MYKEQKIMDAKIMQANGLRQWEIAESLGVSERTVRNYLKSPVLRKERKKRASKLDPYRDTIRAIIDENPCYNIELLYTKLVAADYTGKISILRDFAAQVRKRVLSEAVIRFETMPGQMVARKVGYVPQRSETSRMTAFDAKTFHHIMALTPFGKRLRFYGMFRHEVSSLGMAGDSDIQEIAADILAGSNTVSFEIGSAFESYWGVGAAWKSDMLRSGVNVVFPSKRFPRQFDSSGNITNGIYTRRYLLVDGWLLFNLGTLVKPAPLLVISRTIYGMKYRSWAAYRTSDTIAQKSTLALEGGLGWQFNKYIPIAIYYGHQFYYMAIPGIARYSEAISYQSDPLSLGNWFNTKDTPDRSNISVKVEMRF